MQMKLFGTYQELSSYIQARFGQPIRLSFSEGDELQVTYTQRILIKDVKICVFLHFDEVSEDSVLLSYKGALGLDMAISSALGFFTRQFPELAAGIHPEDGHRIRINLSEIEKAKALVENVALRAITPCDDSLRIEFSLKVPK